MDMPLPDVPMSGTSILKTEVQQPVVFLAGIRCAGLGLSSFKGANATWQRAQSVSSLNPRPLRIIGTHLSARAARVFACFAPET